MRYSKTLELPSSLRLSTVAILTVLSLLQMSPIIALQVAVIGTTGNIARETVELLSKSGIKTRCLLRHDINSVDISPKSPTNNSSSMEVAAYLNALPNVEMIMGDVTDKQSVNDLVQGCDAVMALQGPPKPNPITALIPFLSDPSSKSHPYMISYIGIKNVIEAVNAMDDTAGVKPHIIRITGKGEDPFSFFSILINMLGNLAKGWNYEGETLLRKSGLDYTIIRPGILNGDYQEQKKARMLKDNGTNMKVSPVSYTQIAELCVDCLKYDNVRKSTLTVMNVDEFEGENEYGILLKDVQSDSRYFPESLISEHRSGARLGGFIVFVLSGGFLKGISSLLGTFYMMLSR